MKRDRQPTPAERRAQRLADLDTGHLVIERAPETSLGPAEPETPPTPPSGPPDQE